jgi:hypothetical protein
VPSTIWPDDSSKCVCMHALVAVATRRVRDRCIICGKRVPLSKMWGHGGMDDVWN